MDNFVSVKLNQQFLVENYKYITGLQKMSYIRYRFTVKSHRVFTEHRGFYLHVQSGADVTTMSHSVLTK